MPKLKIALEKIQEEIEALQFDYEAMIEKYNLDEINSSLIKYFQALQSWTDELMSKLETYEREKESTIQQFNTINLKLSKKYEDSPSLTTDENNYLRERQEFFSKNLSLEMHAAKSKILAVRHQADQLESTLDEIDSSENSLAALAKLEHTPRASFSLVAENTARIIRNALLKIEYFEGNKNFVVNAIDILVGWTENYRVFRTTKTAELKRSCNDDSIDEEICGKWISDWAALRFEIERKLQPIIERGLKNNFPTEKIISVLDEYKNSVDKFFLEERKGIYQKFAFIPGGDFQEKLETESELYKLTSQFQSGLQKIIFDCTRSDDRIFILSWAGNLLDIQIDEIINFAADKEISGDILAEFSQLKQKNFDAYLADAQAYSEEKSRREKQYNSLIFKMRKDLAAK